MKNHLKNGNKIWRPKASFESDDSQSQNDPTTNGSKGFTLVEVMISIGLFTVIMVIGIGAILGVNITNRKTQSMRAIIDNMSFVMEDMARSMRLGDYFVCVDGAPQLNDVYLAGAQITQDGPDDLSFGPCKGISFEPYWNSLPTEPANQVGYFINNGAIWQKDAMSFDYTNALTPPEIIIDEERSGFIVTGSDINDQSQPKITIVLAGTINLSGQQTSFNMQTTVSQRLLDVATFSSGTSTTTTTTSGGTTIPLTTPGSGGGSIPSIPTP